jgi:release factor glutamine methyltransferase
VTDVKAAARADLVASGIAAHEARWLIEEFLVGGDPDAVVALRAAAERRLAGEPLQYIIGHWPFRNLDLDVDPRVLIPRPETEELVDIALEALARHGVAAPRLLDLGCGSGAIGLALLDELRDRGLRATLVAVDQSADALAVARRNAVKHQLMAVSFVHGSWFAGLDDSLRGHFDLIVANPPYVGEAEFTGLDPVLRHEPLAALVAPDADGVAGFADVATIIDGARPWLSPRGVLIIEHGNGHGEAARERAARAGLGSVATRGDLAGHDRFLVADVEAP